MYIIKMRLKESCVTATMEFGIPFQIYCDDIQIFQIFIFQIKSASAILSRFTYSLLQIIKSFLCLLRPDMEW